MGPSSSLRAAQQLRARSHCCTGTAHRHIAALQREGCTGREPAPTACDPSCSHDTADVAPVVTLEPQPWHLTRPWRGRWCVKGEGHRSRRRHARQRAGQSRAPIALTRLAVARFCSSLSPNVKTTCSRQKHLFALTERNTTCPCSPAAAAATVEAHSRHRQARDRLYAAGYEEHPAQGCLVLGAGITWFGTFLLSSGTAAQAQGSQPKACHTSCRASCTGARRQQRWSA